MRVLVRSLTGVGTILAATVGVQTGTGVADGLSNNVRLTDQEMFLEVCASSVCLLAYERPTQSATQRSRKTRSAFSQTAVSASSTR